MPDRPDRTATDGAIPEPSARARARTAASDDARRAGSGSSPRRAAAPGRGGLPASARLLYEVVGVVALVVVLLAVALSAASLPG